MEISLSVPAGVVPKPLHYGLNLFQLRGKVQIREVQLLFFPDFSDRYQFICVTQVEPKSSAALCGLAKNDTVVGYDDVTAPLNIHQLRLYLEQAQDQGRNVTLRIEKAPAKKGGRPSRGTSPAAKRRALSPSTEKKKEYDRERMQSLRAQATPEEREAELQRLRSLRESAAPEEREAELQRLKDQHSTPAQRERERQRQRDLRAADAEKRRNQRLEDQVSQRLQRLQASKDRAAERDRCAKETEKQRKQWMRDQLNPLHRPSSHPLSSFLAQSPLIPVKRFVFS